MTAPPDLRDTLIACLAERFNLLPGQCGGHADALINGPLAGLMPSPDPARPASYGEETMSADRDLLRRRELADDIDLILSGLDKATGNEFKAGIKTLGEMMYVRGQEIASALRAHNEGAAAMQWRAIESAPRDGTAVIVLLSERFFPRVVEARWRHDLSYPWWDTSTHHLGWDDVLAWQPMPPPPPARNTPEGGGDA